MYIWTIQTLIYNFSILAFDLPEVIYRIFFSSIQAQLCFQWGCRILFVFIYLLRFLCWCSYISICLSDSDVFGCSVFQVDCLQVDGVLQRRNLVYCASTRFFLLIWFQIIFCNRFIHFLSLISILCQQACCLEGEQILINVFLLLSPFGCVLWCGIHSLNMFACHSAGKSFVAEILMLRRVVSTGKIALLVLPYVSICAEKVSW